MQLPSPHEGLALIGIIFALAGLALAVTGTGSTMFPRRHPAGGPDGRARQVGLAVLTLGAAVAMAALATG